MTGRTDRIEGERRGPATAIVVAALFGVAAVLAAALLLWSREGGELFLQSAFAAVAGCL
ncbi:hypothetical protein ACFQ4O_09435 [Methylopila musalis]|uniref:Uncharacterized protein n=1 Tax=Methylopila musalis TaxID=1134781 RepID=A0ABW3Z7J0_9HYPH